MFGDDQYTCRKLCWLQLPQLNLGFASFASSQHGTTYLPLPWLHDELLSPLTPNANSVG